MTSTNSDAARTEQIITEFFAKSLHIILESRSAYQCSSSVSSSRVMPSDKWFNLALRECPAALENRHLCSPGTMVVDVILVRKVRHLDSMIDSPDKGKKRNFLLKQTCSSCGKLDEVVMERDGMSEEKVIERWVVQYELTKNKVPSKGPKQSSNSILCSLYKKSMLLLRSLYTIVRLLPAYKVFRQLNLSGHLCSCFLAHRVSPSVEPFTHRDKVEMNLYGFTPVDTSSGRLCVSVLYVSKLPYLASQPSVSMFPKFITEYVGSPIVDPVKRFCSFPGSLVCPFPPTCITGNKAIEAPLQSGGKTDGLAERKTASDVSPCSEQRGPAFTLINTRSGKEKVDVCTDSIQTGMAVNKIHFLRKDKSRIRSRLSRPSFQEAFGGYDINCPFDLDDKIPSESGSRKSRLPSIGALVDMMQKAQPLSRKFSSAVKDTPKTTADALSELAFYIEMKNGMAQQCIASQSP